MKYKINNKFKILWKIFRIINSNYKIDPSVFRDIEQRRQNSEAATSSIKDIIENSPSAPPLPKKTDSTTDQIVYNSNYEYTLNNRQLDSILDLLSLSDATIDKTSEIIRKIDSKALVLVNEINDAINAVTAAYQARISIGCSSNLIWSKIGISTATDAVTGAAVTYSNYRVIKDPSQEVVTNYYGIKYYQKPSNRDYGFNIIAEVEGSILVGSQNLAVVGTGSTLGIQIGDEITDNLNTPIAFNIGSLPKVVGFGVTSLLGITTSISGNVSLGSSVIAYTGVGSTGNILIGNYVSNIDVFESDTKVIGFGTIVTGITSTRSVVVPAIKLSKVSISSVTNGVFGFSTYTEYQAINLSEPSNVTIDSGTFTVIRNTEDITQNFSYTDSPLDPVTIGIIDTQRIGSGNEIGIINNGESPGPSQWRKILNDSEPSIGAGTTVHYVGASSCPSSLLLSGCAPEGYIYTLEGIIPPSYISLPLPGLDCSSYTTDITTAESNLQSIIDKNLPEIQKLISASLPLRKYRDGNELKAWSYLQSASYLRSEMNNITSDINSLSGFDYNSL